MHLHFDVNKTVIMNDEASGQSLEEAIENILAEEYRGREDEKDGGWVLDHPDGDLTYGDWTRKCIDGNCNRKALRMKVRFVKSLEFFCV